MPIVKVTDLKMVELEPGNIIELDPKSGAEEKPETPPAAILTAVLIRHLETMIGASERAFKNTGNVFHEGYNRAFQHMLRDVKNNHFLDYIK